MLKSSLLILFFALGGLNRPLDGQSVTEAQFDRLIDELTQIKTLLARQTGGMPTTAPRIQGRSVTVGVSSAEIMGLSSAAISLVEFGDYECPYCNRFHTETFAKLKATFIDTGKLRFIMRDLPLDIHKHAMLAAEGVRCAGEHNVFWNMRDRLASNPNRLGIENPGNSSGG
jgi:protein-disulfide isomerase